MCNARKARQCKVIVSLRKSGKLMWGEGKTVRTAQVEHFASLFFPPTSLFSVAMEKNYI